MESSGEHVNDDLVGAGGGGGRKLLVVGRAIEGVDNGGVDGALHLDLRWLGWWPTIVCSTNKYSS